ncbi:MAG: WD40/YVTN/BNR-like repeat-containing protein [Chitinophagaceae bacterium]
MRQTFTVRLLLFLCCCYYLSVNAQFKPAQVLQFQLLDSGKAVSYRGISVVNEQVFWVSGSKGTVLKSTDGGNTLRQMKVAGYEQRDFRDIHAFDSNTAVIMAVAEPAVILRTTDGGNSWQLVLIDSTKGMFLDAMDFNGSHGIVVGDPIKHRFYMATTNNGGASWQPLDTLFRPKALPGEACFASSGTNIVYVNDKRFYLVTGGGSSRLITSADYAKPLPLQQGKESTGANSIAVLKQQMVIVGGDFAAPKRTDSTHTIAGSWEVGNELPYMSCVQWANEKTLVVCGLNGVFVSGNSGTSWEQISTIGFHTMAVTSNKKYATIYLAGGSGKVGKLLLKL